VTASPPPRLKPLGLLLLMTGAYAVLVGNWQAPVALRFSVGALNPAAFALGVAGLPLAMLATTARLEARSLRWAARALAGFLLAPGLLLGGVAGLNALGGLAMGGRDPGFERLHDVPVGAYHLAVYRWNGGATTDFEIVARQERVLLPGLRLVRDLEWFTKSDTAMVVRLGPDSVRVIVPWYGSYHQGAEVREYRLRSLVGTR